MTFFSNKFFFAPEGHKYRRRIYLFLGLIPLFFLLNFAVPPARFLWFFCCFLCFFFALYNLVSLCILTHVFPKPLRVLRWIMRIGFGLWLVSFLTVTTFLIVNTYPDDTAGCDYIVVLGAGVNGTEPTLVLRRRLDHAMDLAEKLPQAKLILCGGQGNSDISEAEAMRRYLVNEGIDSKRCILEDASRDTAENLANTASILEAMDQKNARLCVVTSGFHVLRAKLLGQKYGLTVVGDPVPMAWHEYHYYLREYFSILIYAVELTGITLDTSFLQM